MKTCGSCPHPKAAHGPDDGACRFGGCLCGEYVEEKTSDFAPLNVPVLGYTAQLPVDEGAGRAANAPARAIVGFSGLTLDGKEFPYATAGDWVLTFSDDGLAILNIPIVVTLPQDPAVADG